MVNSDKAMLQTIIAGYPPILGGGNQFTIALFCKSVLNKQAAFIPQEVSSPSTTPAALFSTEKNPAPLQVTAHSESTKKPGL